MKLEEARKAARYSKAAVAGVLGISLPTYHKMERNPETITIEDAKKLAELFGVSVSEIFFAHDCN